MEKFVAYKVRRPDCSGWIYAGRMPGEVAEVIKNELDSHDGLSAEECGELHIEAYETTQEEVDALPEFPGWLRCPSQ